MKYAHIGTTNYMKKFTLILAIIATLASTQCVFAYPSYEHALPGTAHTGGNIIPSKGLVRIPVLVIGNEPLSSELDAFFSNQLDVITFRNYWRINSLNKYDPKTFVIKVDASADGLPSTAGSQRAKSASWKSYVSETVNKLIESDSIDADYLDTSGPGQIPDNWTDGMIILAPGISEPIISFDNDEKSQDAPATGPFAILDIKSTPGEILEAFSSLMGFTKISGNLCNSISDASGALFMVDGYNRARAGWVEVVNLEGPVKNILILPSSASESIYRIGRPKEYFLIEGRAPSKGLDAAIKNPGIAIYHIDETSNMGNGATRSGAPIITNVVPNGVKDCAPDSSLFRNDDGSASDYFNQNSSVIGKLPTHLNWNTGEPSDAVIVNIDVKSHFPIMTAAVGYE